MHENAEIHLFVLSVVLVPQSLPPATVNVVYKYFFHNRSTQKRYACKYYILRLLY